MRPDRQADGRARDELQGKCQLSLATSERFAFCISKEAIKKQGYGCSWTEKINIPSVTQVEVPEFAREKEKKKGRGIVCVIRSTAHMLIIYWVTCGKKSQCQTDFPRYMQDVPLPSPSEPSGRSQRMQTAFTDSPLPSPSALTGRSICPC